MHQGIGQRDGAVGAMGLGLRRGQRLRRAIDQALAEIGCRSIVLKGSVVAGPLPGKIRRGGVAVQTYGFKEIVFGRFQRQVHAVRALHQILQLAQTRAELRALHAQGAVGQAALLRTAVAVFNPVVVHVRTGKAVVGRDKGDQEFIGLLQLPALLGRLLRRRGGAQPQVGRYQRAADQQQDQHDLQNAQSALPPAAFAGRCQPAHQESPSEWWTDCCTRSYTGNSSATIRKMNSAPAIKMTAGLMISASERTTLSRRLRYCTAR